MTEKILSKLNSTNIPINANNTFTGTIVDVTSYQSVMITIFSDVDSIMNGIEIYFGATSDNMIKKQTFTYAQNSNFNENIIITDKYFKLIYNNGSSNMTIFNLQTFLNPNDHTTNIIKYSPEQLDLFGNLKTASSYTLLDVAHLYDKNTLLMDEYIVGGASSTYNNASIVMSVSSNNDRVIRQSRLYTTYQPGKSLCIRLSGVINNSNSSTTTSRLGYFDDNNGLFFEYSNNIMKVVIRNNTSDTSVSQSDWNIDSMDGNGPSGLNINFSYNMIYYIEFAYLGVGLVKFGFVYSGKLYLTHIFYNTTLTRPYMITPNLPIRYEISSSGGSGSLICTCASVQSEGGYNILGNIFSGGYGTNGGKSIASNTTAYLMAIKLANFKRSLVKLQSFSIYCSSSGSAIIEIYKILSPTSNPITSPTFTSITNSNVMYDISGTAADLTNGILIYRGYCSSATSIDYNNFTDINGSIYLTAGIDHSSTFYPDYIVARIRNISNQSETYYGSFNWIEI